MSVRAQSAAVKASSQISEILVKICWRSEATLSVVHDNVFLYISPLEKAGVLEVSVSILFIVRTQVTFVLLQMPEAGLCLDRNNLLNILIILMDRDAAGVGYHRFLYTSLGDIWLDRGGVVAGWFGYSIIL